MAGRRRRLVRWVGQGALEGGQMLCGTAGRVGGLQRGQGPGPPRRCRLRGAPSLAGPGAPSLAGLRGAPSLTGGAGDWGQQRLAG